jgi:hypothetical protein
MKKYLILFLPAALLVLFAGSSAGNTGAPVDFKVGWASLDITPDQPVLISGQFHARVSEGIMDPLTVTALALESGSGPSSEKTIMISADLVVITDGTRDGSADNLRDNVRRILMGSIPELRPEQVVLNATHTHSGPFYSRGADAREAYGVELDAMPPAECLAFLSERIAIVAERAWNNRKTGGISYGQGQAVVSHNRLQVDLSGNSNMYGNVNRPEFSHMEGFEDHSVNLLFTWDGSRNLTGVLINLAAPSQVSEHEYKLSADFWHDTRVELRKRLGKDIFIFAQCSAAGDQSPHTMVGADAEERMQQIKFPGVESGRGSPARRKQIAIRISDAVTSVFPYMRDHIEWDPVFSHRMEVMELSRRLMSKEDVEGALSESEQWRERYEQLLLDLERNPAIKDKPRWYYEISRSFSRMSWGQNVSERYELEKVQPLLPVEAHVIRIGDIVIATNPFELYLDYGLRIKARSPAVQTFIVQLAGSGTYLPTSRSIAGGAYGAVPASTLVGPAGGEEFVEKTLEMINKSWLGEK